MYFISRQNEKLALILTFDFCALFFSPTTRVTKSQSTKCWTKSILKCGAGHYVKSGTIFWPDSSSSLGRESRRGRQRTSGKLETKT